MDAWICPCAGRHDDKGYLALRLLRVDPSALSSETTDDEDDEDDELTDSFDRDDPIEYVVLGMDRLLAAASSQRRLYRFVADWFAAYAVLLPEVAERLRAAGVGLRESLDD